MDGCHDDEDLQLLGDAWVDGDAGSLPRARYGGNGEDRSRSDSCHGGG